MQSKFVTAYKVDKLVDLFLLLRRLYQYDETNKHHYEYQYSGVQSYEVQARGLSPLLIKILAYLTFMNTAISSKIITSV
jgi:hypothetical protein